MKRINKNIIYKIIIINKNKPEKFKRQKYETLKVNFHAKRVGISRVKRKNIKIVDHFLGSVRLFRLPTTHFNKIWLT